MSSVRTGETGADDAHSGDDHHGIQQEGAEVVTGLQQDPHGSHGSNQDVSADDPHPGGAGQVDGVPVQTDKQADYDADAAGDGGDGQRSALAVNKEAEQNSHHDEQQGDHSHGGVGLIVGAVRIDTHEGAGHDGGESGHHQHQGQVRED